MTPDGQNRDQGTAAALRDISEVAAVEVITTAAGHLMSAAAGTCGLAGDEGPSEEEMDLAEARVLIGALAGLVTASPRPRQPARQGAA